MPARAAETIARCEWCGLVDHHLVAGECPRCRQRIGIYDPHRVIREAAEARRQEEAEHARDPA